MEALIRYGPYVTMKTIIAFLWLWEVAELQIFWAFFKKSTFNEDLPSLREKCPNAKLFLFRLQENMV